jgi:protein-L-isoaspartate(D-aspartate) O-methyltransferase
MLNFTTARINMVESQIRPNKVTDPRLIEAMESLPREDFVPSTLRSVAYVDRSLKVGEGGRYLLDPMVFARLVQAADPQPSDLVLDIACSSGYSTAVLARLAGTVVAVESDPALVETANAALNALGIDNAVVVEGDPTFGYAQQGPYDVILINGEVGRIPHALTAQLAPGGRLVAVLTDDQGLGRATLLMKGPAGLSRRTLFDANVPRLPEFEVETGFVF